MTFNTPEIPGRSPANCRYLVIVWDNNGQRRELPGGDVLQEAKGLARTQRTQTNRTVKIAMAGNTLQHWSRSTHLARNHWSARATADEWFI